MPTTTATTTFDYFIYNYTGTVIHIAGIMFLVFILFLIYNFYIEIRSWWKKF